MNRAFFAFLCLILISACTQRMICPAYQSAFIYDQDELRKKFSYLNEDSTPKVYYTASKTKYLIAEPISYRKKIRNMSTVEMKDVNVKLPNSLQIGADDIVAGAELDLAARSIIDSIYIVDVPQDSVAEPEEEPYMITTDKEVRLLKYDFPDSLVFDPSTGKYAAETPKYVITQVRFNVEQDNYMWYLRNFLILPDVKLSKEQQSNAKAAKSKSKKEKKGVFGFFKGLFNKKNKAATDSTSLQVPAKAEDDFDYVDEDELPPGTTAIEPEAQKKKGAFSFLKKKDKAASTADPSAPAEKTKRKKKEKKVKTEEAKPEEEKKDDDDGF